MALEASGYAQAPPNPMAGQSTPIYGGGGMNAGNGYQGGMPAGGGYGGGMGGYGGGGMPGQYGTNYPLGAYGQNMVVTANLEHGQPIILDPETGQPLPPGVVPNLRDPNQYYPYQPGEAVQEALMWNKAQSEKTINDSLKNIFSSADEYAADKIKEGGKARDAAMLEGSKKIGGEVEKAIKDPEGYLTEKAKGLQGSLTGAISGQSSGSKSGGGSLTGGSKNVGSSGNFASDLGYQTGQGIKGVGGAIQGIGKGLTDFGKGVGEGLGFGKGNPDRVKEPFGMSDRDFSKQGTRRLDGDFDRRAKQIGDAIVDQGFGLKPDLGFLKPNPSDGLKGSLDSNVNFGFRGKVESNLQLNSGGGLPQRPSSSGGRPEMRRMEPRIN